MIYEIRNFISGKPLTRENTRKTKWPTLIRGTVMQNKKKTIEEDGHVFIHSSTLFLSSLFCPSFEARGGEEERAWEWGCLFIGMIYLLILELAKAAAITFWLGLGDDGFLMHQLIDVISEYVLLMLYYKYYTCLYEQKKPQYSFCAQYNLMNTNIQFDVLFILVLAYTILMLRAQLLSA